MKRHELVVVLLCALGFCAPCFGQIVVEEHNDYALGIDYFVYPGPEIRILNRSLPGVPYDFDCYDRATGAPATIRSITANQFIGPVDVMVTPHDGRPYGAANIGEFNLAVPGVTGRIVEINISGNLSTQGPTAAASAGTCYVGGNLGSYGLNISGHAGDITLNGSGPHTGTA